MSGVFLSEGAAGCYRPLAVTRASRKSCRQRPVPQHCGSRMTAARQLSNIQISRPLSCGGGRYPSLVSAVKPCGRARRVPDLKRSPCCNDLEELHGKLLARFKDGHFLAKELKPQSFSDLSKIVRRNQPHDRAELLQLHESGR